LTLYNKGAEPPGVTYHHGGQGLWRLDLQPVTAPRHHLTLVAPYV